MNEFRIVQVEPLTHPLPYAVEERRRGAWYAPWPKWRFIKEWHTQPWSWRVPLMKFQTPTQARLYIERRLALQAEQLLLKAQQKAEQQQREQLPRVIEVLPQPY